jgi:2-(1,2-epoxy-1,2-dihydrophenyl)acetyl-CoA isomerase
MNALLIDSPGLHIRRLLINRPEARNAVNQDVRDAIFAALSNARDDAQVRTVVIGGAGGVFSAGGDLPSMVGISEAAALARMQDGHRIVSLLWTFPKPVVAAVEGVAAGAGAGIALLADRMVIGHKASLLFPFLRLGLVPDWGLMQTVIRRAGHSQAARIFMENAAITGVEAAAIGLADQAVGDAEVMAQALAAAERFAGLPMAAFARMKLALRGGGQADPLNLAYEAKAQTACLTGPEFVEGYAAFREKRVPLFTDIVSAIKTIENREENHDYARDMG